MMETEIVLIRSDRERSARFSREEIADFLYTHLDQYGDNKQAILACLAYAFGDGPGQDGLVLAAHRAGEILGVAVVNDTNMKGYIPEHILVYLAVREDTRGQGIGKRLMERVISETPGDIALHVEPENPARYLYEKFGFTNKYLEMRLAKKTH